MDEAYPQESFAEMMSFRIDFIEGDGKTGQEKKRLADANKQGMC
jgi:hypothetical protein